MTNNLSLIFIATMAQRKTEDNNIRKIMRSGKTTLCVSIPVEYLNKLGWREKQKVVVNMKGAKIIIEDWKK